LLRHTYEREEGDGEAPSGMQQCPSEGGPSKGNMRFDKDFFEKCGDALTTYLEKRLAVSDQDDAFSSPAGGAWSMLNLEFMLDLT
jgi:hypothetical protein